VRKDVFRKSNRDPERRDQPKEEFLFPERDEGKDF
jgi:hypothetical protein